MSVFFMDRQPTADELALQHRLERFLTDAMCQIGTVCGASPLQTSGALITVTARAMAACIDTSKGDTGVDSTIEAFSGQLRDGVRQRLELEALEKDPLYKAAPAGSA